MTEGDLKNFVSSNGRRNGIHDIRPSALTHLSPLFKTSILDKASDAFREVPAAIGELTSLFGSLSGGTLFEFGPCLISQLGCLGEEGATPARPACGS